MHPHHSTPTEPQTIDDLDDASAAHLRMIIDSARRLHTPEPDPTPALEHGKPWPVIGSPGVDEDLAHAILHADIADSLSVPLDDWTIGASFMGAGGQLEKFSPRSGAAASQLAYTTPNATLAEHLRLAIEACDRYLDRHPGTPEVTLVRDDLFRAHAKAGA